MKWLLLTAALLTGGCTSQSLYQELGGKDGLDRIAGRFIAAIGEDPGIRPYFAHSNLERFHEMFSDHLCHAIDGPCEYEGDDMVNTHIGMEISEADFNRTVDLLIEAMDQEGIPHRIQNQVLSRLAPLRDEIIYR